ncbi:GNAT family N-acetyltransferase [Microbacterium sp. HD4P20]|uniref:GNAT family N-acetyltransferase n=1 Tax=Microbacterium sp. HD4P20 TaxID=2864874 RepID=UPI001C640009|nr:GNAT family N-acetyltransferase [Microbacterium sp. HD4P20]MCP2637115.1 GNAT family N-acetyltransferase [Microbacterium sp. HD4P20]
MAIDVRPATVFDDVATVIGPKKPESSVCFCLSYRIPSREANALRGPERAERVRRLMVEEEYPIGVLAYDGDEVVGWAAVAPRSRTHFATFRKIPYVDDADVWSLWCFRVHPGHRKKGVMHALIDGAVVFAREQGAPAIEGYPVDNGDARVDLTMAYVGTRRLFEHAGFAKAADTSSVLAGFPRVLMRRELR